MGSTVIQLLVLAGIAIFLIVRLANVLGSRDGYEKRTTTRPSDDGPSGDAESPLTTTDPRMTAEASDKEIAEYFPKESPSAVAMKKIKGKEPSFFIPEFLEGAKEAYEVILMAFENGEIDDIVDLLSDDVRDAFVDGIGEREDRGLSVEAQFVGIREAKLEAVEFNEETGVGEMTVRFVADLTSVVRNADNEIVEGNPNEIKRQRDVWTFARRMGTTDPNWKLVATQ